MDSYVRTPLLTHVSEYKQDWAYQNMMIIPRARLSCAFNFQLRTTSFRNVVSFSVFKNGYIEAPLIEDTAMTFLKQNMATGSQVA